MIITRPLRFALRTLLVLFALCALPFAASAQSSTATLSGTVVDENNAVIPGAGITVQNRATSLERHATTNDSGSFTIPLLPPGEYTVLIEREGFTRVQLTNIILNVGDQKAVQVQLKVGDIASTVEVRSDATLLRTDGSVGTVVDRQFVENIPLNGRSFQSLLQLTPGVSLVPAGGAADGGQFSVNGQRTNANYVTVDGVSANTGVSTVANGGQTMGSGASIAYTAQGTTSGLVSVDALEEFRIQTSTYAPEFGRMPGGQISLVTRSGGNQYHGTLFEYFRNDALDATDWFVNANRLAKPALRQNQFGGTFSGPLPFLNFGEGGGSLVNSGKDRTFFFFSYEGLRLIQPNAGVTNVVSLAARNSAHPAVKPYVDAQPLPNGPSTGTNIAQFAASWSDTSNFDAIALRIDHKFSQNLTAFGRYSHTPSFSRTRSLGTISTVSTTNQINSFITGGFAWVHSERLANDLRVNYTETHAPVTAQPDTFGGASVPPASIFREGSGPDTGFFTGVVVGVNQFRWGLGTAYKQRQFNIVESIVFNAGSHSFKFGGDFRRLSPSLSADSEFSEQVQFDVSQLSQPRTRGYTLRRSFDRDTKVAFDNLSLYAQDTWRVNQRLTLTYGIRWEYVPPPRATAGRDAIVLANIDDPYGGQVHIAPEGTSLWKTRYNYFAPRIGASYALSRRQGHEMVIRGGFGLFHDLGYGPIAGAYAGYPFTATKFVPQNMPFPLTPDVLAPPTLSDKPSQITTVDPNLKLPLVYQWNISAERSFGLHQTVTVSYVGAEGKRILKFDRHNINLMEWPAPQFTTVIVNVNRNIGHSDYRALQLQFQRRMHRNLQAQVAYTFGRSRDTSSSDIAITVPSQRLDSELDYGYSDYDIRHLLTAAVTFQTPAKLSGPAIWSWFAKDWAIDTIFRARTGLPLNVTSQVLFNDPAFPIVGTQTVRANVVSGQPFWLVDPTAPGGRRLNRAAFSIPATNTIGNLPRGVIRGFGAQQIDLALRRDFRVKDALRLQMRFEVFNVFNTPNFGNPVTTILAGQNPATFGASSQMLNRSLGGLSALYQVGGPRGVQLATKIVF